MELSEAFLQELVRLNLMRELDGVNYLGCIGMTKSPHTVMKLGEADCDAIDVKLSLGLCEPNASIVGPKLWKLEGDSIEVEGSRRGDSCRLAHLG